MGSVGGGGPSRTHGERSPVRTRRLYTPLGEMLAGATDGGLCLLEFAHRKRFTAQMKSLQRFVGPPRTGSHPLLDTLKNQLDEYFAGNRRRFDLPLLLAGTPFQEKVWRALRAVPYGETISYAELAGRVGSPGGGRAVGRANGDNRIAIVVPCHRIVRADGSPGGYSGGLDRKRRLLALEAEWRQRRLPIP